MNAVGLYVPGTGVLHRLPAGGKLLVLLLVGAGVIAAAHPWVSLAALVVAVALYSVAGLSLRHAYRAVRVLWPFLLGIAVFQGLVGGWSEAVRLGAQLAALVLLANAVTLTTRVSAMLELFQRLARPLRHVGADPDRVGLVLALTVRSIPMVDQAWRAAREGYLARGLSGRPYLIVVPVIVQLLRMAEATGEALVARGMDEGAGEA